MQLFNIYVNKALKIGHERILAMDEDGNDEEPFDLSRISIEWHQEQSRGLVPPVKDFFCFFVREQQKSSKKKRF